MRSEVRLYHTATGKAVSGFRPPIRRGEAGRVLQFSPDGRYLLVDPNWDDHGPLSLLDARTGELVHTLPDIGLTPGQFFPHGRTLLCSKWTMEEGNRMVVLEVWSGQKRFEFAPPDKMTTLAISPDGRFLATGDEKGTALLWDVEILAGPLPDDSPEELWTALAGTDAEPAYRALLALVRRPADALALARKHLRAADGKRLDAAAVARLIEQLDDDDLVVRERAQSLLKSRQAQIRPALEKALAGKPSPEARRRLRQLLEPSSPIKFPHELVVSLRGVELLERIGSTGTRALLDKLAAGHADSPLTHEARAALARLGKKGNKR
jgi:hypothetical protein